MLKEDTRLPLAAVLSTLSLLLYLSSLHTAVTIASFLSWGIVVVAGYISGRSGDLALSLTEMASLGLTYMAQPHTWVSTGFLLQATSLIFTLYVIGLGSGLVLGRGRISWSVPRQVPSIRDYLPSFIGAFGVFLFLASFLGFQGIEVKDMTYLLAGLADSALMTYALSLRQVGYLRNVMLSGIVSLASFVALPITVALIPHRTIRGKECEGICLYLGEIKKVLKNGGCVVEGRICHPYSLGRNNHLLIVGPSGSGKTTLVKSLVLQASLAGINVVVLDFHGEYRNLGGRVIEPDKVRVNPLSLMGKDPDARAEEVAELIATNYRLGSIQRAALHQLLIYAYNRLGPVTPSKLLELIEEGVFNEVGVRDEVLKSLLPYLKSLAGTNVAWIEPEEVGAGLVVVDLSRIDSVPLQNIIAESVLNAFYYLRKRFPALTMLAVEEAHRVFRSSWGVEVLTRIFREGRKFGISVAAVFQDPKSIEPTYINNSSQAVIFRPLEEAGANYIVKTLSLSTSTPSTKVEKALKSLSRWEALGRIDEGLYVIRVKPNS